MFLIVLKDKTSQSYVKNNAVECAMRALCAITGKKFYSDDNIMACKCPDKSGDMTNVHKFYQRFPSVISSDRDIYRADEAADYYFNIIGGSRLNVGYGLVTDLCDNIYVEYSLVKTENLG